MPSFDENLLVSVPLFRFLDVEEARELSAAFEEVHCQEGEALFHFGDGGDSLYLIQRGHVELFVRDHTGQKVILKVAGPGDIFGELSLLDNGPRTASALALEECRLAKLGQSDLQKFLLRKPQASMDLLAALGGMVRETNDLVRRRVAKNVNEEIASDLSWGQKIANFIAEFSGSMPFLFINAAIFAGWVLINLDLIPGLTAFDPYPFGFLTMAVSLEAIFLSIFVLLAQNLQAAKDKIRSDIEYDINLKAELEISFLHEKVDHMNAELLKRLSQIEKSQKREA